MTEVPATPMLLGVELLPEGVLLTYARFPHDARKNGLTWSHQVLVPNNSDYDEEIEAVVVALDALLKDVLEDEATAEAIDLTDDEDEEDDE